MCGRFTNQYTWRELVELYRITEPYIRPISNLEPRFNFAPMQRGPVVRLDKEGRREPVIMRWGLVPSWSKDDKDLRGRRGAAAAQVLGKLLTFRNDIVQLVIHQGVQIATNFLVGLPVLTQERGRHATAQPYGVRHRRLEHSGPIPFAANAESAIASDRRGL